MKWLVQLLGFQQRRYISTRMSIKKQETGNPHECQSFFRSENLEEMRNKLILSFLGLCLALALNAQTLRPKAEQKKVYNEDINPIEQIDQAIVKSKSEGKFVICQVGGNWCPWCLRFADFITNDTTISKVIDENFVYIHVNYNPRKSEGE